jgi:hypothetical protein
LPNPIDILFVLLLLCLCSNEVRSKRERERERERGKFSAAIFKEQKTKKRLKIRKEKRALLL